MMSHLPTPVVAALEHIAGAIEEHLQAHAHNVIKAMSVDPAFNQRYIQSGLERALVSLAARTAGADIKVGVTPMSNGGCEISTIYLGVERLFRVRRAQRDHDGRLVVRSNSESILTERIRTPELFDVDLGFDFDTGAEVTATQQWVFAWLLNPVTGTLSEVVAAKPVDLEGKKPYRLVFGPMVPLAFSPTPPQGFQSDDDDLDLGEGTEEDTDSASA